MASRKKGPALFEVIRAAQQKQIDQQRKLEEARTKQPGVLQNASALLGSPSYWLNKGKTALVNTGKSLTTHKAYPTTSKPVMRSIAQPVGRTVERDEVVEVEATPFFNDHPPVHVPVITQPAEVEPVVSIPVNHTPAPAYESAASAAARAVREEIAATATASSDPIFGEDHAEAAFIEPKNAQTIDSITDIYPAPGQSGSISNWFNLKLNYTTGLVAGCLLLGAVAVGLIATSGSASDPKLADGKIHPNAITNLQSPVTPQPVPPIKIVDAKKTDEATALGSSKPQPDGVKLEQLKPIRVPTNVSRENGKQYIVLISYPEKMKADADAVVKYMADNGVAVTAEKGLPGYSTKWYSVLTAKGFDKEKVNGADYNNYKATITRLMKSYAKDSKFKSFIPDLYTWRVAN